MRYTGATLTYSHWFRFSGRYLAAISAGHLIWEILQLPLYTIWWERGIGEIAFAVAHCTVGDVLIGTTALAVTILLFGRGHAPIVPKVYARVAAAVVLLGVGYTLLSEWYNTREGSWAYASLMPLVPPLGIGLSPMAQWIVIPATVFWWLRPGRAAPGGRAPSAPSNAKR